MTNGEAIARLEMMFQECSFPQKRCKGDCCTCSKAIDALQAEPKVVGDIVSRGDTRRVVTVTEPSDLISRADAIEAVASRDSTDGHTLRFAGREITDLLSALPSADRPIGEWLHRWNDVECSICGEFYREKYNYCPNCGARMENTK